jgi:hypothetical protein
MTLNASGNLSIGNTNDTYKLDVSGQARFTSQIISNSPGGGVNAASFYDRTGAIATAVDEYGTLIAYSGITNNNGNYSSGSSGTALVFRAGAVEQFRVSATNMVVAGSVTAGSQLSILGSDGGGKQLFFTGGTTKYNFMIAAQQNVNNGLEITPSSAAGGSTFSTPAIVVTGTGSVGIGTTSPGSKLSIVGLPTSSAGLSSGDIYVLAGVLMIV